MKYSILFLGLLCAVAFPLYAQEWTPQDSLRLHRLLNGGGEVELNPDVLKEMGADAPSGSPKADVHKTWLDFNTALPVMPRMPEKKVVLYPAALYREYQIQLGPRLSEKNYSE